MNIITTKLNELYNQITQATALSEKDETLACVSIIIDSLLSIPNSVDSHSGHILPLRLSDLSAEVKRHCKDIPNYHRDRIYRLIKFISNDIEAIINLPRNRIERTHQMLSPDKAKTFDSRSLNWLCKRPGKNIKEKLASVPHILCVKREFSVNTSENRLFKEVLKRLKSFLTLRKSIFEDIIDKEEKHLLSIISKWLRETDEYIGDWKNIPPNNVLLQDKHYRKIWDAWGIIRKFDNYFAYDLTNVKIYRQQIFLLCLIQKLIEFGVCFAEMPIVLEPNKENDKGGFFFVIPEKIVGYLKTEKSYSSIFIRHINNIITLKIDNGTHAFCFKEANNINFIGDTECVKLSDYNTYLIKTLKKLNLNFGRFKYYKKEKYYESDSVTIDLYRSKLNWATAFDKNNFIDYSLIRQYWSENNLRDTFKYYFSMPLSDTKAWFYSEKIPTFSMNNLLWNNREEVNENYSKIANDITKDIARKFKAKKITILLPDIQDDLNENTKSLRLALENAFLYSDLSFLPTSIAAVYSVKNSWEKIESDTCYAVIEKYGNILTITPITTKKTKYSKELKKKLPQTNGFIFEHHQSIKKELSENINIFNEIAGMANQPIFCDDQWNNPENNKEKEVVVTEDEIRKACPNNKKIKVLVVSNGIKVDSKFLSVENLSELTSRKIANGGEVLRNLEESYPEHPLWTDDLPSLIIEVTDSNNMRVPISLITSDHDPIITNSKKEILLTTREEKLFIPRNNKRPKFIIKREIKGKTELFKAELILPQSYSKEVLCNLRLYYTYAAAEPYRLNFLIEDQNLSLNASIVSNKENPYKYSAPQLEYNMNWNQIDNEIIDKLIYDLSLEWWEEFGNQCCNPDEYIIKYRRKLNFVGHGNQPIYFKIPGIEKTVRAKKSDFLDIELYDKISDPNIKYLAYKTIKTINNDKFIHFKAIHLETTKMQPIDAKIINYGFGYNEYYRNSNVYEIEFIHTGERKYIEFNRFLKLNSTYSFIFGGFSSVKLEKVHQCSNDGYRFVSIIDKNSKDWPDTKCRLGRNMSSISIDKQFYALIGIDKNSNMIVNALYDSQPQIIRAFVFDNSFSSDNLVEAYYDDSKELDYAFTEHKELVFTYADKFIDKADYRSRMDKDLYAILEKDLPKNPNSYRTLVVSSNIIGDYDYNRYIEKKNKRFLISYRKKLFRQGLLSVNSPDCPDIIKNYLKTTANLVYSNLVKCNSNRFEIFFEEWLSNYGVYAPEEFANHMLNKEINDSFLRTHQYCLGNLSENWQKEIWKKIIRLWESQDKINDSLISITNIVIKNNVKSLEYFNYDSAKNYLSLLIDNLFKLVNDLKYIQIRELQKNITSLFYCLQFRKSNDDNIKELLSAESELSLKAYDLLEKIKNNNIKIEFSNLEINNKSIISLLSDYLIGIDANEMITILDDSEDDDSDEDLD